jgi:putative ABC transport system permease protein
MWGFRWMEILWQDVRFGVRMLVKSPTFTIVAVLALALGIGANSAIFSVVNTILLRPLPYPDPDSLVMVWEERAKAGYPRDTPSPANFISWKEQSQTLLGMSAYTNLSVSLTGVGEPERIEGQRVSASLFPLLGVEPHMGRAFLPEEDQPGGNRVAMMSHGLWQRRFGSDPNIVGKALTLNGESRTIVGVMPANFEFPSREIEIWVPIAFPPEEAARRGAHFLQVIARTKPGVSVEQAQAEMHTVAAGLQQQYPQTNTAVGATLIPLHEHLVGDIRPALLILLGAVGFVLLIACVNVANLLLARASARQKEIAVRIALGAGRLRLIRQFLTESILLAGMGGVVGLLLAVWSIKLLTAFIPANISQAKSISIDAGVLLFTVGISLLTGLIFGLAPALQASRFSLNDTLKEGGRDSTSGGRGGRVRNLLVVTEIALALVLLIGAGLLINSFWHLRNVDPGFQTDHLLTMKVVLPPLKYPDTGRRAAFYDELTQRVQALPGVRAASVTTNLPLTNRGNAMGFTVEGRPEPAPGQTSSAVTRVVSPNYFQTMGIKLLRGREFTDQDSADAPVVLVVGETMAKRFWPGEDPVGKRLKFGSFNSTAAWLSVVGVVKDVKHFELNTNDREQVYLSYKQAGFFEPRDLVVRTEVEPLGLAASVRSAVWGIDKDQPVSNIRTMDEIVSESVARQRFNTLLLGIFAVVALILASIGIYGVMSYSVTQRTHEIGIRMALGAQALDVLKLTVGQGLKLVLLGLFIGLAAAFGLTRVMSSLLFGVSPTDPITFVVIPLVLFAAAMLASYIPARRAARVDPLIALRNE